MDQQSGKYISLGCLSRHCCPALGNTKPRCGCWCLLSVQTRARRLKDKLFLGSSSLPQNALRSSWSKYGGHTSGQYPDDGIVDLFETAGGYARTRSCLLLLVASRIVGVMS